MKRVRTLVRLNGRLLQTFSARTLAPLHAYLPVRLVLPHVEPILAANVGKEIEKDRLVIARAAQAPGERLPAAEIEALYEATRAIDREFLDQLRRVPVALEINYAVIRPIRLRRIEALAAATRELLHAGDQTFGLRDALQARFSPAELERLLLQLLALYAEETHALSRAVQLPLLLAPARDVFADRLLAIMRQSGAELAREAASAAFRSRRRG